MVLPAAYNKGLYLINHKSYLIILTLECYPTKHYLMEVNGDALGDQNIRSGRRERPADSSPAHSDIVRDLVAWQPETVDFEVTLSVFSEERLSLN